MSSSCQTLDISRNSVYGLFLGRRSSDYWLADLGIRRQKNEHERRRNSEDIFSPFLERESYKMGRGNHVYLDWSCLIAGR